jgi:hypothetical protein
LRDRKLSDKFVNEIRSGSRLVFGAGYRMAIS